MLHVYKHFAIFCAAVVIGMTPVPAAYSAEKTSYTAVSSQAVQEKKTNDVVKNGWYDGKYYENGKRVKGWKVLDGESYYFKKDGSCVTGIGRKGKYYYYFTNKGTLLRKTKTINGTTYYINSKLHLEAYSVGDQYYRPSGEQMDDADALDFVTFLRAKKTVAELIKPSMTSAAKLKACFMWVHKRGYRKHRSWKLTRDWPARYANDHFLGKGGCCRSDGSAFAYLARALGYTKVYVCMDGVTERAHCWAEVNGKVYDPLFASRKFSKYYGSSYKTARLHKKNATPVAVGYVP